MWLPGLKLSTKQPDMPLVEISAQEVLAHRSTDKATRTWPVRGEVNRVEPIARPDFDAPFQLIPGENIFTIGSCFARNVESKLLDRGYRIPALDIFKREDFAKIGPSVLNNYGVPSIRQEIAWAVDPDFPFSEEASFSEVVPGKFVDNHLTTGIRPAAYEVVKERREAIRGAMTAIKDCRVVVITLGLTEVWYDKKHDIYVNTHPRLPVLEKDPDRFCLRVMSFDDTMDHLRKTMDTIDRFAAPGVQVIVTVSPVPMSSTHRKVDVMVANTYSKSVLRSAAEHIVAERENVHYFPSYESIVLTDRQRAFKHDMVHIEQELVDLNVGRMVQAYTGEQAPQSDATLLEEISASKDPRQKWQLVKKNRDKIADPAFATLFVRTALNRRKFTEALSALDEASLETNEAALYRAEALIGLERFDEAFSLLQPLVVARKSQDERSKLALMVDIHIGMNNLDAATAAAIAYGNITRRKHKVYEKLARGYRDVGQLKKSIHYFEQVVAVNQSDAALLDFAEVLFKVGRHEEAHKLVAQAKGDTSTTRRRKEWLASFASSAPPPEPSEATVTPPARTMPPQPAPSLLQRLMGSFRR